MSVWLSVIGRTSPLSSTVAITRLEAFTLPFHVNFCPLDAIIVTFDSENRYIETLEMHEYDPRLDCLRLWRRSLAVNFTTNSQDHLERQPLDTLEDKGNWACRSSRPSSSTSKEVAP
jgi:hypothetical protein